MIYDLNSLLLTNRRGADKQLTNVAKTRGSMFFVVNLRKETVCLFSDNMVKPGSQVLYWNQLNDRGGYDIRLCSFETELQEQYLNC